MGPSCSSPRTASSMVSARRAMRPIVPIYPEVANDRHRPARSGHLRTLCDRRRGGVDPPRRVRPRPRAPGEPIVTGKRRVDGPAQNSTAPKQAGRGRPRRSAKQRLKRVALWLLVAGLTGVLLLAGAFFYFYQTIDIPDPNKDFETQTSFVYYADGKTELGRYATQNRVSLKLDQIPQQRQDAVVAAENRTFWTDKGIDPKGIIRAAFNNARGGSTQGASTITQQYVKILYLSTERSYTRKIKEAILSLKMQKQRTKSQILEGYLNTIYFGRSAYGVQAAAHAYFNK